MVELNQLTFQVEYLFFIDKPSKNMLLHHGEILILDCTYNTIRFHMPLAILTGVTGLNSSFYCEMCFMKGEKEEDYKWLIRSIKDLFKELDIPLPLTWLSDGESSIPAATASKISPRAVHLLCVWHIEKNVLQNCRKLFSGCEDGNELWIQFFGNKNTSPKIIGDFQKLIYATSPGEFDNLWQELRLKYMAINNKIISYLDKEIIPKKEK